jgi:hypothetical protein
MEMPLVEPVAVPDIFVSGLGKIEDIGGCLRFTFYAYEQTGSEIVRVVKLRLCMVPDAVSSAAAKAIAAVDTTASLDMFH